MIQEKNGGLISELWKSLLRWNLKGVGDFFRRKSFLGLEKNMAGEGGR